MPNRYLGHGSSLARGNDATPSTGFTTIPQTRNINFNLQDRPEVDVTVLSDPAKSFRGGLRDFGTIEAEVVYDPDDTVHNNLENDYASDVVRDWKITLTDAGPTTFTVAGFVQNFGPMAIAVDTAVTRTLKIRCTAAPVKA